MRWLLSMLLLAAVRANATRNVRQAPNGGGNGPQSPPQVVGATPSTQQTCSSDDCTNHGTCIGTKAMPFCICQIGYAGARCQETYCDSARECGGHGWCMGTTNQFTCLCNIGYSGTRCELQSATAAAGGPAGPTAAPAQKRAEEWAATTATTTTTSNHNDVENELADQEAIMSSP